MKAPGAVSARNRLAGQDKRVIVEASQAHGVRVFLLIAFGLTWLPLAPVLIGWPAMPVLMPVAPALAAIVVRRWVTGEGFADLGFRPQLGQVWPCLAVALAWPLMATPLAVGAARLANVGTPDISRMDSGSLVLWAGVSVVTAPVFLGEELGWRGYLQVRVFIGRPWAAAALTGALWALWHFPLWLIVLHLPLWMLLLATGSLTTMSVFFGWLKELSGTIWAPAMAHSTNNTLEARLGAAAFEGTAGDVWLPVGPSAVIAVAEAVVVSVLVLGRRAWRLPFVWTSPRR